VDYNERSRSELKTTSDGLTTPANIGFDNLMAHQRFANCCKMLVFALKQVFECLRARAWIQRLLFVSIVSAQLCHGTLSAEFKKARTQTGAPDLIEVAGDLMSGDEKEFVEIALNTEDAIVVFHSPGGNLSAGIGIGRVIRLKGFSTLVPDNMLCASACALAWLAGRVRIMSATGRIGFHAAYTNENGQANVSSAANAVVGAYLNQLGLPTSAIIYITQRPPAEMQWLNFADARQVGIDVKRVNTEIQTARAGKTQELPVIPASAVLTKIIAGLTEAYVLASNSSDDHALAYLEGIYSDEVSYYGKLLSKSAVLMDKRTFFQRWSKRTYSLLPDTLQIHCGTQSGCKVDGTMNWEASSVNSRVVGSASFALVWTMEHGSWRLSSETSRVLDRKVSR
jgi:hypothetical protein